MDRGEDKNEDGDGEEAVVVDVYQKSRAYTVRSMWKETLMGKVFHEIQISPLGEPWPCNSTTVLYNDRDLRFLPGVENTRACTDV